MMTWVFIVSLLRASPSLTLRIAAQYSCSKAVPSFLMRKSVSPSSGLAEAARQKANPRAACFDLETNLPHCS
jgi:hypothetical protein